MTRAAGRGQRGLTLVELMVSMLISSVVMAAAIGMGYSLMNSYRDHRAMVLAQRGARVSLEIMGDAVRTASAGVPDGLVEDLIGCWDVGLDVINSRTEPDQLRVIYASGGVVTSIRNEEGEPFRIDDTQLRILDASGLEVGDYLLLTNLEQGLLTQIRNIQPFNKEFVVTVNAPSDSACAPINFPAAGFHHGHLALRAQMARFFIDDTGAFGGPTLMLDPDGDGPDDPEPLAEGVEDMQIAVGVDVNGDGTVFEDGSETDEWFYNHPDDAAPPAITVTPWRAVRITLVGRSTRENSTRPTYFRPAVEDRAGAAKADEFRRRVLTTTIELRNLEGSP